MSSPEEERHNNSVGWESYFETERRLAIERLQLARIAVEGADMGSDDPYMDAAHLHNINREPGQPSLRLADMQIAARMIRQEAEEARAQTA